MKLVTLTEAMGGNGAGDKRLLPDAVAAKLHAEGGASAIEDFGPNDPVATPPEKPERRLLRPARPMGAHDKRIAHAAPHKPGQR